MEGPGEDVYLPFQLEKKRTIFVRSRCKHSLFNFESILTQKGPGFSNFGTAEGGREGGREGRGGICLPL